MSQKCPKKFQDFDENLIDAWALFFLEFESTIVLITFYKNRMAGKSLALELCPKNFLTNQNTGFSKQQLTNEFEVDFCMF